MVRLDVIGSMQLLQKYGISTVEQQAAQSEQELDINPLIANEKEIIAVDARVIVRKNIPCIL